MSSLKRLVPFATVKLMKQYLSPRQLQALEFAARAHQGQVRKSELDTPYISHPFAVGIILLKAGFDEDVIIAGILHDCIEDTAATPTEITTLFGPRVAELVQEVTEDKTLPYQERKAGYLEHLRTASLEARAISAADLLANRMSILAELKAGNNPWQYFSMSPEAILARDQLQIAIIKETLVHEFVSELEEAVAQIHTYIFHAP